MTGRSRAVFAVFFLISGVGCLPESEEISPRQLKNIEAAAAAGDPDAQFELGQIYEDGDIVPESDSIAAEWYAKAAEQGHGPAQFSLGLLYAEGDGVPEDRVEAIRLFESAAMKGDATAQFNLGAIFSEEGEEQDFGEALKWYRAAAFQGDLDALHALGIMYEQGDGVLQSNEEAYKFYKRTADEGHPGGMYGLGSLYESGDGVEQSLEDAIYWYREAADAYDGDPQASNDLAWLYATCRVPELRNGRMAAKYALIANADSPDDFSYKDTLAAAYARCGWFEDAVAAQVRAIELVEEEEDLDAEDREDIVADFRTRLELYEKNEAYAEPDE